MTGQNINDIQFLLHFRPCHLWIQNIARGTILLILELMPFKMPRERDKKETTRDDAPPTPLNYVTHQASLVPEDPLQALSLMS